MHKGPPQGKKSRPIDALMYTPGAFVAGHFAGDAVGGLVGSSLVNQEVVPLTKQTKKMVNNAIKKHKVPNVMITSGAEAKKLSPVGKAEVTFDTKSLKRSLKAGKLPSTLGSAKLTLPHGKNIPEALHELGHVKQYLKNPVAGAAIMTAKMLGPVVGPAAAVVALSREDLAKYAPAAGFIAASGDLASEAGASGFAVKELARQKGFKAALKSLPFLGAALTTYLTKPIAVGAALYGTKKLIYG